MHYDPQRLAFRSYNELTDKNCIYSNWLKSYKTYSYFAKRIRPVIFFAGHQKIIDHLLSKPTIKIIIACDKSKPDEIFGWLAFEPKEEGRPTIHYVYVKGPFQKMGIGRALFRHAGIEIEQIRFTHWTFPVDQAMERHPEMLYDPYEL